MTDEQQRNGQKDAVAAAKGAKSNGTAPTVTARRPISKDEYARTTKAEPDATAVIPAVRDDQPAPRTSGDEDTQLQTAVGADGKPKVDGAEKTAPVKSAPAKKAPAKKTSAKAAKPAAAAAAVAAPAVAPTPTAPSPAPATPAPATSAPEQKKPEQKKPEQKKPEPAKSEPTQQTKTAPAATTSAAPGRSAKLKVKHVEPWSVTKMAFVVSVALMIVSVVAVTVFWTVMQITGVWGALNDSVSNVLADDSAGFDITDYLGFGRVVGLTLLVSSLNVIFMTALATIAAHLYNLASGLLGGIELTFGERN